MGGAIALGHPLGATGTRLVASAISGLKKRKGRRAWLLCVSVAVRRLLMKSRMQNEILSIRA